MTDTPVARTSTELVEHGWMIERPGPEWWTGTTFDLKRPDAWTKSATNGIRFANDTSALVVKMALVRVTWKYPERAKAPSDISLTEHQWS